MNPLEIKLYYICIETPILYVGSTLSKPLISDPFLPEVVEPVRVPSFIQIDRFENYSHSIGPCDKKYLLNNNIKI